MGHNYNEMHWKTIHWTNFPFSMVPRKECSLFASHWHTARRTQIQQRMMMREMSGATTTTRVVRLPVDNLFHFNSFIRSSRGRQPERERDREYQIACCCCMVNSTQTMRMTRWHNTDSLRYLRTLFLSCCLHLPLHAVFPTIFFFVLVHK